MENGPETETSKRAPSIRTMKSDVSEFLKTSKPSLISVLARQTQWDEYRGEKAKLGWRKILAAFLAAGVIAAGIATFYFQFARRETPTIVDKSIVPPSLIFFEDAKEINIGKTRRELTAALAALRRSQGTTGSLNRLVVTVKNDTGAKQVIESGEFFGLASGGEPPAFSENISAPPQFFIYLQNSGPSFGMLMEARNPPRALQDLLAEEPALQQKLQFMFLGSPPPPALEPFKDMTYKNIDFRFLDMDSSRELGIGYTHFPAKRLIVITTSLKAMRLTIDRLFENR